MILVGVCELLFCGICAFSTETNQYMICEDTLHGKTGYITFSTPYFTEDSIYLGITEEEYRDSMCRIGMRQGYVFNDIPYELMSEDRCVRLIGDYIMARYNADYMRATAALFLIQTGITYESDEVLYGTHEFWSRPTETLYHLKGDCEDSAILMCAICHYMGIKAILLDGDSHISAGVCVNAVGNSYEYKGDMYYACGTTFSEPHMIGYTAMEQGELWVEEHGSRYLYYLYSFHKQMGERVESWIRS